MEYTDFQICGPVREKPLYYGRQSISEEDIAAVVQVLRSDYLTGGPQVAALEKCLREYVGAAYAVAVSSGTAALHCACIAAGIKAGDEVITTPLTFAASANCILYCGAKVVFADVDPQTYNISPASIRSCITHKTKAVIAVDFTGQAVCHKEIRQICEAYNLVFIEDAAHAIGTKYNGRAVGSLADMTCFSFHPVKTVTSGEGGAVTTNSALLYKRLVLAHAHGITRDAGEVEDAGTVQSEGGKGAAPWYYEEVSLGYNYRLTDFQSALLRSQMSRIDDFRKRRSEIARQYDEAFTQMREVAIQREIAESDTCRHLYVLRLHLEKLSCTRRVFFEAMQKENIFCQVHYIPVYYFPYYQQMGYKKGLCPNAESIYDSIMSLPLYPSMSSQDVSDVIKAVKKVVARYKNNE